MNKGKKEEWKHRRKKKGKEGKKEGPEGRKKGGRRQHREQEVSHKSISPCEESHVGQAKHLSCRQGSIIKGVKPKSCFKKLPPVPSSPYMLLTSFICSLLQTHDLAHRDVAQIASSETSRPQLLQELFLK